MSIRNSEMRTHESRVLLRGALRAVGPVASLETMAEVPMDRRRADVVFRTADEHLVSIELKLSDWARALSQAVLNQLWVDRSYIAIPPSKVLDRVVLEARHFGIGVIVVERGQGSVACEAANSPRTDVTRRTRVIEYLEANA